MDYLILLAVLPGIAIVGYIYYLDKIEKEPVGLLLKLMLMGAVMALPIVVGEMLVSGVTQALFLMNSVPYLLFDNFIGVALIEELGKYFALKKLTWRHPAFDYTFDAVVYAVCSSMGFALLENVLYVMNGGLGTAIMRALLSLPGHAIFGVFMGIAYGQAKYEEKHGNTARCRRYLRLAILVPVLLHGFYDFCLSFDSSFMLILFVVFVLVLDVISFATLRRNAKGDHQVNSGDDLW